MYQPYPSTSSSTTPRPHYCSCRELGVFFQAYLSTLCSSRRGLSDGFELLEQRLCGVHDVCWVASQYDLPNHTNQQIQQVWKPQLINFQHQNSACRQHFQVEQYIFLTSTVPQQWTLRTVVFCTLPYTTQNPPFVQLFQTCMSLSCTCSHQITCFGFKLPDSCYTEYQAGLLTILGVLNKPF